MSAPPQGYPPQQPYGYPPQQGYPPPPQQGYPPPPQQGYPPPPQQGYAAPPPHGYPPHQPPPGQFPPPPQQPGYPPAQQHQYPPPPQGQPPYGAPPQQYPPPSQGYPPQGYPPQPYPAPYPTQPGYRPATQQPPYPPQHQGSFPPQPYAAPQGYGAPPNAHQPGYGQASPTYKSDIAVIRKACKGFGCDDKGLISILGYRDAATINAIRDNYKMETGKDLIQLLTKETSGDFQTTVVATALGPDDSEAYWAHKAMDGVGTDEVLLTECLLGKKNWQMANIKKAYKLRYGSSLERALKGDLSGKTEKLFVMAIEECRQEDWIQPDPNRIAMDVKLLRKAGEGVIGTDEITFAQVFTRSNDAHLRAVAQEYERTYGNSLRKVIDSEFSGHLKQAFSYILEGALNKAERDARLLEDSMKGFGTKDTLLISRLIRVHWDQGHLEAVKRAYFQLYSKDLIARIRNDTSGNYERMLVALAS